jgi:hypothetical protein
MTSLRDRRESMRSFERSGIIGTPEYGVALLSGTGFALIGLLVSINGLLNVIGGSPSKHTTSLVLFSVLLSGSLAGLLFAITGFIKQRKARSDLRHGHEKGGSQVAVAYETTGWTTTERANLTKELLNLGIPHEWSGTELNIDVQYEERVDQTISIVHPGPNRPN